MKKAMLSILTFLYMMASSGFAMEIHYCMGEKAGIEIYAPHEDDRCGRCGMKEKKGGCCADELKFYKISDSHKNIANSIQWGFVEPQVLTTFALYDWQLPAIASTGLVFTHAPPIDSGPSRNILFGVFRI